MSSTTSPSNDSIQDVKQLGLVAAIVSLGYVFWVVGAMEMVERLAFYGVRSVAGLYAKDPVSAGGLGLKPAEYGTILMAWALFQSIIPIFVGGLADRYGYKRIIALSTAVKISGYLAMAASPTYWGFLTGAILLATGTAIFKPGIQGTLVKSTNRQNSSMAWGIFYQTVNIGGFLGPVMAGHLRQMAWQHVFLACAAIICLNFLLLLTYKEPGMDERLELERQRKESGVKQKSLAVETFQEMFRPHVFPFLMIFGGFYFMFYSLFDVLPQYIDEWVNTRTVVQTLFGDAPVTNSGIRKMLVMNPSGTAIQPEGLLNINAGMIMISCFFFAYLSSRLRALHSMVLGTALASVALFMIGYSALGWFTVFAIMIFSVGEMLSSPKFSEFVGNIAPSDKKAMYLGLCQISVAIGMTAEGQLGQSLYGKLASKEAFARQMLGQQGVDATAIPQGEGFAKLAEHLGQTPEAVTQLLYQQHHNTIMQFWFVMASVGIATSVGIFIYGKWIDSRKQA